MLLSDNEIEKLSRENGLICPYVAEKTRPSSGLSYGPSSYGYDIRLGNEFIFYNDKHPIDPKEIRFKPNKQRHIDPFLIYPGGFCLATSMEYLRIPPDVTGLVKDKSTYARCGIAVQNTVLEAGWAGQITLEISNHAPAAVMIYPGDGIAQILFELGNTKCNNEYNGRYQSQVGVTTPWER